MSNHPAHQMDNVIRELAEDLITFIQGEEDRVMEAMQAGGRRISDNERHTELVSAIVGKIKAIM